MRTCVIISATLLISQPLSAQRSELHIFQITRDHASCMIKNRSAYMRLSQDVLFIYVSLCPVVVPTQEQISDSARNVGPNENPKSLTLVIERRHLLCFFKRLENKYKRSRVHNLEISIEGCTK
jgi:hypothetical protein